MSNLVSSMFNPGAAAGGAGATGGSTTPPSGSAEAPPAPAPGFDSILNSLVFFFLHFKGQF